MFFFFFLRVPYGYSPVGSEPYGDPKTKKTFLDTGKAEGIKGTYLYSRGLDNKEIKNLLELSQTLQLGNKVEVWVYNAQTLELINGSPFSSLGSAASNFNVDYRTIPNPPYEIWGGGERTHG